MKSTIAFVAVFLLATVSPAFGQRHAAMAGGPVMSTMMKGLSASERQIAHQHMSKMTAAERAVMMKRCRLCYSDPHRGIDVTKMTTTAWMKHVNSGLTRSERKTMGKMLAKMTPEETAVAEKMMMNCCKHGISLRHGSRTTRHTKRV